MKSMCDVARTWRREKVQGNIGEDAAPQNHSSQGPHSTHLSPRMLVDPVILFIGGFGVHFFSGFIFLADVFSSAGSL